MATSLEIAPIVRKWTEGTAAGRPVPLTHPRTQSVSNRKASRNDHCVFLSGRGVCFGPDKSRSDCNSSGYCHHLERTQ